MNSICLFRPVVFLLFVGLSAGTALGQSPNFVLILVDDLGWRDLACYGSEIVDTPNIDALSRRGVRMTNFYASAAVCSPTRFALQSGQNPARGGITAHIPGHWRPFETVQTPRVPSAMPTDVVTIAERLKRHGYQTGYVGKWHLGNQPQHGPANQGYDVAHVLSGAHAAGRYREVFASRKKENSSVDTSKYRTETEADLATDFIEAADQPYYLMVSPFAVHIPLEAEADKVEKYQQRLNKAGRELPHPKYAAMIEHVDDMVGRIVEAIDRRGDADRTYVIFTSDNGALFRRYDFDPELDDTVSRQTPLRGEKGMLYEAGIRVPMIVAGPDIPAGTQSDAVGITHDLYPTMLHLSEDKSVASNQVHATPPNEFFPFVDGINIASAWRGEDMPMRTIHFDYPHFHHDRPSRAMRSGRWKLIRYLEPGGPVHLFDLHADPGETEDLADEKPDLVAKLVRQSDQWATNVVGHTVVPNPAYDPERANDWYSYRTGEKIDRSASKKRRKP